MTAQTTTVMIAFTEIKITPPGLPIRPYAGSGATVETTTILVLIAHTAPPLEITLAPTAIIKKAIAVEITSFPTSNLHTAMLATPVINDSGDTPQCFNFP